MLWKALPQTSRPGNKSFAHALRLTELGGGGAFAGPAQKLLHGRPILDGPASWAGTLTLEIWAYSHSASYVAADMCFKQEKMSRYEKIT